MVKISIEYTGDLHCKARHEPSKRELETDAPLDNGGRGESFSPTDLVATGLGACMATIMGIYAKKNDLHLKGMKIQVIKEMSVNAPRRIRKLTTEIWVPLPKSNERKDALERAALTCPVHQSLHPEIEKPVVFHWLNE